MFHDTSKKIKFIHQFFQKSFLRVNMYKTILIIIITVFIIPCLSAQTADEVIANYVEAIGGKEKISQIKSLYLENTTKVMGMKVISCTTILNGKGLRTDTKFMGSNIITCYNDKSGWSVNSRENTITDLIIKIQNAMLTDQIFIGGPFLDYIAKGYKVESEGRMKIGNVSAIKIKMIMLENIVCEYFFDPSTYYLLRTIQKAGINRNKSDIVSNYSDYRPTLIGYIMPYTIKMEMGGKLSTKTVVSKITFNQPVDSSIFIMP